MKRTTTILLTAVVLFIAGCKGNPTATQSETLATGAEQLDEYLPLLKGKKVGMMGNHTSLVGDKHLVDVLLDNKVDVKFAFAPEHGFRGTVTGGHEIGDEVDSKTGLPIFSMYGKSADEGSKAADSAVASIDIMIFDIQDVGARFYTYITSLHQLMQLCANNGKTLVVLDRPNPNGDQVDGPVRSDDSLKSDVGYDKIALVHGLTVGELAQMINGEGWLDNGKPCTLHVIKLKGYTHKTHYQLPVAPSPSLTSYLAVRLYPSLCLFEATPFSVGRGTDTPFQVVGYPDTAFGDFTFTPQAREGINAKQEGKLCYGIDLQGANADSVKFTLKYLIDFYNKATATKVDFFSRARRFDQLAGNIQLQEQIKAGLTEEQIRESWSVELDAYKQMRKKYLLYEDFE